MGGDRGFRLWAHSSWFEIITEYLMLRLYDSFFKKTLKHWVRVSQIAVSCDDYLGLRLMEAHSCSYDNEYFGRPWEFTEKLLKTWKVLMGMVTLRRG